jgi:hypothetical protein
MRHFIESLDPRCLLAGTVLFVHGADRSGGFIEATNDAQRTEQLASIDNASTAGGNHGWKQLADQLRGQGYTLTEIKEPLESGAPPTGQTTGRALDLTVNFLRKYDLVVFASNNAVYSAASVDAVDAYLRGGGAGLFISDGNFGSDWRDAPASDTQFLSRYGLAVNQDNGTYAVRRDQGDFTTPNHPVLFGVNAFDGEGVSPIRLPTAAPAGVTLTPLARAKGVTFDNGLTLPFNQNRGDARQADARDASLVLGNVGAGRFAAFFDRNTFFNTNGAGTNLTRFDNARLATNLFNWATDKAPPAVASSSFDQGRGGGVYVLRFRLDDNTNGTLTRDDVRLRDRRTGANLAGNLWTVTLSEGNGFTDVTIRINAAAPTGPYQLRVERRRFADDSGNVRTGAVRYAFTLLPRASSLSPATTQSVQPAAARRVADDVLSTQPTR